MIDWLLDLDTSLFLWLNGDGGAFADTFFHVISGKLIWIPLYLGILYFIWRKAGTRNVIFALLVLLIAVGLTDQICNLFKNHWLPKFRPTHAPGLEGLVYTLRGYLGAPYGTISAHTAISFMLAVFTSLFFRRKWYTICICIWAALVSYSRIYLGLHFPLDILFGILLGVGIGFVSFHVYKRWLWKLSKT